MDHNRKPVYIIQKENGQTGQLNLGQQQPQIKKLELKQEQQSQSESVDLKAKEEEIEVRQQQKVEQQMSEESENNHDNDNDMEEEDQEEESYSKEVVEEEEEEEEEDQNSGQQQQDPFLNFVTSYSVFINESHNTVLDLDEVLLKLNDTIKKYPPPKSEQSTLIQFYEFLQISPESVTQQAQQLKQLPDAALYQCVQNVEKLNVKLMLDYNVEVKKGKAIGIINHEDK